MHGYYRVLHNACALIKGFLFVKKPHVLVVYVNSIYLTVYHFNIICCINKLKVKKDVLSCWVLEQRGFTSFLRSFL